MVSRIAAIASAGAAALILGLAAHPSRAQSGGATCSTALTPSCLTRLGAGALPAGGLAQDDVCASQLEAYRACLVDLAGASATTRDALPVTPQDAEPRAPQLVRETVDAPASLGLADAVELKIEYPQIVGSGLLTERKINEYLKAASGVYDLDRFVASAFTDFRVEYATPEVLSIVFIRYTYMEGAANGNETVEALNINLETGEPFELRDVFRSGWEDHVNGLVRRALDEEFPLHWFQKDCASSCVESVRPDQPFGLNGGGVRIAFGEYEVGPGVYGAVSVRLPIRDLREHLNPNGPLGFMR